MLSGCFFAATVVVLGCCCFTGFCCCHLFVCLFCFVSPSSLMIRPRLAGQNQTQNGGGEKMVKFRQLDDQQVVGRLRPSYES